jgi:hypothetical protein
MAITRRATSVQQPQLMRPQNEKPASIGKRIDVLTRAPAPRGVGAEVLRIVGVRLDETVVVINTAVKPALPGVASAQLRVVTSIKGAVELAKRAVTVTQVNQAALESTSRPIWLEQVNEELMRTVGIREPGAAEPVFPNDAIDMRLRKIRDRAEEKTRANVGKEFEATGREAVETTIAAFKGEDDAFAREELRASLPAQQGVGDPRRSARLALDLRARGLVKEAEGAVQLLSDALRLGDEQSERIVTDACLARAIEITESGAAGLAGLANQKNYRLREGEADQVVALWIQFTSLVRMAQDQRRAASPIAIARAVQQVLRDCFNAVAGMAGASAADPEIMSVGEFHKRYISGTVLKFDPNETDPAWPVRFAFRKSPYRLPAWGQLPPSIQAVLEAAAGARQQKTG